MTSKEFSARVFFWSVVGIAIVIVYLALTSCEKQQEFCWDCKIYYYERYNDGVNLYEKRDSSFTTQCGYSESDISKYEKWRTMPPHPVSSCGDIVRWQDCVCRKQKEI